MIGIYQIFYKPEQMVFIQPPAIPYFNADKKMYEYGVFRREYFKGELMPMEDDLVGFLSWSATKKVGISIQNFVDWIEAHPGNEAYGLNPKIYLPMFNNFKVNFWQQGNAYHPNLLDVAQTIFNSVGYGIDLIEEPCDENCLLTCNYWVGNKTFWDDYIEFCQPISEFMLDHSAKDIFFADYPNGYYPYIMERLWTTFVTNFDRNVRILHA